MRYFMDSEFHEDGRIIDLISFGIVSEDGREYYAVCSEFDPVICSDWVRENVLPKLTEDKSKWKTRAQIRQDIEHFLGDDPKPEFWAWYADYDWVVFCQLWGKMIDLPRRFPMYCRDFKQVCDERGITSLPIQDPNAEHDALADARWLRDAFQSVKAA